VTADALQRKLAALLSADVAGDSRVLAQDEVATGDARDAERAP
jgi:hypothetical protein